MHPLLLLLLHLLHLLLLLLHLVSCSARANPFLSFTHTTPSLPILLQHFFLHFPFIIVFSLSLSLWRTLPFHMHGALKPAQPAWRDLEILEIVHNTSQIMTMIPIKRPAIKLHWTCTRVFWQSSPQFLHDSSSPQQFKLFEFLSSKCIASTNLSESCVPENFFSHV